MNDDNFSGDKIYEKQNNYSKWILTPRQIIFISGGLLFVAVILWLFNITGVISISDHSAPNIYLNGNETVDLVKDQAYDDSKVKAVDNRDGDITSKIIKTGTIDTTKTGTYVVTYTVEDKAGNKKTINRTIRVIEDKKGPNIKYAPNGVSSEKESHLTKVSVIDPSGIKTSKYQWTTDIITTPTEASFITDFTTGLEIKTPDDQTGTYYLWVYAEDNKGNKTIDHSNKFIIKHTATLEDDKVGPKVSFDPNGSNVKAQSKNVTVKVVDEGKIPSGVKIIKYQWTTSTNSPEEASFVNEIKSDEVVTTPSNATGDYYLWIYATDNDDNITITRSNAFKLGTSSNNPNPPTTNDTTPPTVNFQPNGNNNLLATQNVKVNVSDASGISVSKYLWSTSSTAPSASSITNTFNSGQTISSPSNVSGSYYLWIYAKDNKGNIKIARSNVYKIGQSSNNPNPPAPSDKTVPAVSFGTNGGSTYAKSFATKITVTDSSGVKTAKYLWSTSSTAPSATSITNAFTSGQTINTPSGATGKYYLWIYAEDIKGNKTTVKSNAFSLDNTKPSCSTSGYTSSWTKSSQTVKISCSDGHSGVSTCNGVSGTSTSKTYSSSTNNTYSYTVADKAGNTNSCTAAIRIDKTAPTYKISGASTTWTDSSRKITISCSDAGSGMKSCWNGTSSYSYTFSAATIKTFTATATDKLGNSVSIKVNLYTDYTAPSAPTYSTGGGGAYVYFSCGHEYNSGESGIPSHCIIRCGPYSSSCSPTYVVGSGVQLSVGMNQTTCAQTLDTAGNRSKTVCYTRR